jgi:DNA-binding MarR family transcriptional regulator
MAQRTELLREIFSTMSMAHRLMHAHVQCALGAGNLSMSQIHHLTLIHHNQPISLKTLAAKMQLTPGAVTQLVDALEKTGYVMRTQDQHDRRITNISVSASGAQKLTDFKKTTQHIFRQASRSLDEQELEIFLKVQQKMLTYFETQNAQKPKKEL